MKNLIFLTLFRKHVYIFIVIRLDHYFIQKLSEKKNLAEHERFGILTNNNDFICIETIISRVKDF